MGSTEKTETEVAKPTGVYRPPGARGRETPSNFMVCLCTFFWGGDELRLDGLNSNGISLRGRGRLVRIVNLEHRLKVIDIFFHDIRREWGLKNAMIDKPLSKAALKNQKKRGAGKKDDTSTTTNGAPAAIPAFIPTEGASALQELEKKMKTLQKKMKAIKDIKAKRDAGEKLELTQIAKIDTEAAVAKEIEDLTKAMNSL
jgi:translation initiation factor 2A